MEVKEAPTEALIGGAWRRLERRFPVVSPATGERVAEVADCGEEEAREALEEAGGAPERARELAEAFFRERRRYPLYPEAEAFLAEARRRGLALALLTNGVPDLQREKLVGAGLAHHFSLVLLSGEVGIGKPDPRLFRMALCAFGVAPEEAAMVGDNPQKDVRGARLAGVRAVWVDRGLRPEDPEASPDLRVGDLREVFLAEAL